MVYQKTKMGYSDLYMTNFAVNRNWLSGIYLKCKTESAQKHYTVKTSATLISYGGQNDPKTNKGFGLKHIVEKHGGSIKELGFEVEDFIPIVVQYGNMFVKKSDEKKLILENETFRIVIQTRWDNQEKIFLLTAFDLRKKPE